MDRHATATEGVLYLKAQANVKSVAIAYTDQLARYRQRGREPSHESRQPVTNPARAPISPNRDCKEERMSNWVFDEDAKYWFYWPMCSISGCQHRICFGLSDKYCYPHSTNGKSFPELMRDLKKDPLEQTVRRTMANLADYTGVGNGS